MDDSSFFKPYVAHVAFRSDRYGKATLFENGSSLVGLNCLEPGQLFEKHAHEIQTRFYILLEGSGRVSVGAETRETVPGTVIWVPPGYAHKIENTGETPMVLLVGISPANAD